MAGVHSLLLSFITIRLCKWSVLIIEIKNYLFEWKMTFRASPFITIECFLYDCLKFFH